ncbi:hypothetical protein SAMN05216276_10196 [Streptosporangium subroseum]|uniref:Uncharacterized protein n=1 Tax=Streptosporangium subroseum TaxID=106412 RepID=A0A239IB98_9ACTN|nr:hypothetical protein SAMN05216276_10196 [Streptosporangium subroseum]
MPGTYDGEMTTIECGHLSQPKPLGHRDHGGISRTQWEIGVYFDQITHSIQVFVVEVDQNQASLERPQESRFRFTSLTLLDELADFRDNRDGNEKRTRVSPQKPDAEFVMVVSDIDRCNQRP